MLDTSLIDWEAFEGALQDFDDGHVPENITCKPQLVNYSSLFSRVPQVHVYANAMNEALVDQIYEKTVNGPLPSWGDYVTMDQIQNFWENTPNEEETNPLVELTARYLQLSMGEGHCGPTHRYTSDVSERSPLFTRSDLSRAHGVAVWALSASVNSQVPYHLDYAEQIRYQSNVIVPPLLAGTLQCTRSELEGGDFLVWLDGLSHYERHGYKGKKLEVDGSNMVQIPYRFNQLTCHLGNLPHASSTIQAIDGDQKRVIVGFNLFGHDIGPLVQQAPEHSDAFRRKVQAQRLLFQNKKGFDLKALKKNKPLAKMLVLAKRERIKIEFQNAQERLAREIPKRLPASVHDLMYHFSVTAKEINHDCWPTSPTDVQVYLHHKIIEGVYRIAGETGIAKTKDGLISPQVQISLVEKPEQ